MFAIWQIRTCLHHPSYSRASPLWSISFNGLWAELRARLLHSSIYLPRDNCNACLSFPKLPTRPTQSSDIFDTTSLEAYSIISHVEYRT